MKVLFLTRDYINRTSGHTLYLPFQKELKNNNVDVIAIDAFSLYGRSYEPDILKGKIFDQHQLDVDYINNTYDLIVGENFFPYYYEDWHNIKVKRVIWLEDLHGYCPKWLDMVKNNVGIDAIFTHYLDAYNKMYDTNVYHLPHCISSDIHKDYKLPKEYFLLQTGSIGESVYPLRWKVFQELKKFEGFVTIDRPSNKLDQFTFPFGSDYCKEINKSIISFGCTSIFNYTVGKLFEIPSCMSVLFSDFTPEMKKLGFIPNVNFVEITMDTDIKELIHSLSFELLEQIMYNGYQLIHEKHSVEKRCSEFLTYCNNIIR